MDGDCLPLRRRRCLDQLALGHDVRHGSAPSDRVCCPRRHGKICEALEFVQLVRERRRIVEEYRVHGIHVTVVCTINPHPLEVPQQSRVNGR